MKSEEVFTFAFPLKGEKAIKTISPLCVKDTAIAYVTKQNDVRGDVCLVHDHYDRVVGVAYCDANMVGHFFVEARPDVPELIEE